MAEVTKGQKMTLSQIQDLIEKLNNEASRRGVSTRVTAPSSTSNEVLYSTMKGVNDLRRTVASVYRHAGCTIVTCSTVRSDKTGTPTGWDGRDLSTTEINTGEKVLAKGNKAYASQYNLLLSDIEKMNAMCACNTFTTNSCSCDSEETVPCSANGCTSHPATPKITYCYCDPFESCGCDDVQCQTQCGCNTVTCTCVGHTWSVCSVDGCYSVGQTQSGYCDCHVQLSTGKCKIDGPYTINFPDSTCNCHSETEHTCTCNVDPDNGPCGSHEVCKTQKCITQCYTEPEPCDCQGNEVGIQSCPGNCGCNTACGCQTVKTGKCNVDGCYCNKNCVEYAK